IQVVGLFVYIDKLRQCSRLADGFRGCNESIGHGEYTITGPHPCRHQGEAQRIRSAAHPYAETCITKLGKLPFEAIDLRSANKHGIVYHLLKDRCEFAFELHVWRN